MGTGAFVQLPLDTGNSGKQIKTVRKTESGVQYHRHVNIQERLGTILGVYTGDGGAVQAVQASAQNGTSTGYLWFHVPTAVSGKSARVRSLRIKENTSAATPTMPTQPRISLARATFTGTCSGAAITAVPMDTTQPSAASYVATAVTGLTITLGTILRSFLVPPFILAGTAANVQQTLNAEDDLIPWDDEDMWPVVAPGQALVLYQPDAGTGSDIRKFTFSLIWDEIDTTGS